MRRIWIVGIEPVVWVLLVCAMVAPIFAPISGAAQSLKPNEVVFERLTTKQGLSAGSVFCILQDRKGFMWFGTENGLNRWDGHTFKTFFASANKPNTLASNYVEALYEDKEGTLWVGTKGGLSRFDRVTETFTNFKASSGKATSIPVNYVTSIVDDPTGVYLWIGTYGGGASRFNKATQEFTTYRKQPNNPNALQSDIVWRMTTDKTGAIWLGTYNANARDGSGLHRYMQTGNDFIRFMPDSTSSAAAMWKGNDIQALCTDHNGIVWIGTNSSGLWRFEYRPISRSGDFKQFSNDLADPTTVSNNNINAVLEDRAGRLWVGTANGLNAFDRITERTIRFFHESGENESLVNDEILSLYEDRSGTIWIGTRDGISFCNPKTRKFTTYRADSRINGVAERGLSNSAVTAVAEDTGGRLWIGTDEGLNRMESKPLSGIGTFEVFRKNENLPNQLLDDGISALCSAKDGTLWIGTSGGGLYTLNNTSGYGLINFTRYYHDPDDSASLSNDIVNAIIEDKRGTIWIATAAGLNRLDGIDPSGKARFTLFKSDKDKPNESLSNNLVAALCEDRQGLLWIGTEQGLTRLDPVSNAIKVYRSDAARPESLSDNSVQTILEDKQGTLWIGTEGGLNKFNRTSEKFMTVALADTIAAEKNLEDALRGVILGLLEDSHGNLWFSTNRGLCRYSPATNAFHLYDGRDGVQGTEFITNSFCKGRDGIFYFGGVNGFSAFHPDSIRDNAYIPPIVLTGFTRYNRPIQLDSAISEKHLIVLSHLENSFEIQFAALSFSNASRNRYRYRLVGLEEEWHYVPEGQYDARYTSVPPGTYEFRVQACNYDGVWNDAGAKLTVRITPPVWATWWFRTLGAVLFVGFVVGGYQWRVQAIESQRKTLEHLVKIRTQELEETHGQVANANEEINRQNEVLNEQAKDIELANSELQERNQQVEAALRDLKQTQSQLVQSEKMASLGQLTAGVAHEINNPVNFISGAVKPLKRNINSLLQVLNSYGDITPERITPETIGIVQQSLRDIADQKDDIQLDERLKQIDDLVGNIGIGAERIAEIVKTLRTFSRPDEGALKATSLHDNLDATLRLLYNQYKNRAVTIVKDYAPNVPEVLCFPGPLNQVFMNIIHNATQAIREQGEIRITTFIQPDNGSNVVVKIKDNGTGMPDEVKKRIFEAFFTTKEAGMGIGLSITKDIIAKHQGSISVTSELGVGTEFIIVLPIAGPADAVRI
jgi:signal transduction histidine kinase/ligand-binding sensor domain-containing protein